MLKKLLKEEIQVVHDNDLETILQELGVLNKFKRRECKCYLCEQQIDFDNLHSFFLLSGDIKFVCESEPCLSKLYKLVRNGDIAVC